MFKKIMIFFASTWSKSSQRAVYIKAITKISINKIHRIAEKLWKSGVLWHPTSTTWVWVSMIYFPYIYYFFFICGLKKTKLTKHFLFFERISNDTQRTFWSWRDDKNRLRYTFCWKLGIMICNFLTSKP